MLGLTSVPLFFPTSALLLYYHCFIFKVIRSSRPFSKMLLTSYYWTWIVYLRISLIRILSSVLLIIKSDDNVLRQGWLDHSSKNTHCKSSNTRRKSTTNALKLLPCFCIAQIGSHSSVTTPIFFSSKSPLIPAQLTHTLARGCFSKLFSNYICSQEQI